MELSVQEFQQATWNAAPSVRVSHSANQTIGSGSTTALAFDTDIFDRWGMHDTSSNNSRITIKVPGVYLIGGQVSFRASGAPDASKFGSAAVWLNGVSTGAEIGVNLIRLSGGDVTYIFETTTFYALEMDDFIELAVTHNTGSTSTVVGGLDFSPIFWAAWHSRA